MQESTSGITRSGRTAKSGIGCWASTWWLLKFLQGLLMEVTTAYAADWPHVLRALCCRVAKTAFGSFSNRSEHFSSTVTKHSLWVLLKFHEQTCMVWRAHQFTVGYHIAFYGANFRHQLIFHTSPPASPVAKRQNSETGNIRRGKCWPRLF